MGECRQPKHTQHAPSTKTECDYHNGWVYKQTNKQKKKPVTYSKISPKLVNPRDIAGEREEEEEEEVHMESCRREITPRCALPSLSFSFSFSSRWHRSARKGPYALRPVSQQSLQGCPRNSDNICLVEHRSFSTLEGGMSAASFLHSSLLQAINAVMFWPVHVEKVSKASEHLCPAKLQTRYLLCLSVYLPAHSH